MQLWKIAVPCVWNNPFLGADQNPIGWQWVATKHHQEWDKRVMKLAGGLTVLDKVKGRWFDIGDNKAVGENMLEVIIACTREQISEIIAITKKHYNQKAVMAYKISDDVIIQ